MSVAPFPLPLPKGILCSIVLFCVTLSVERQTCDREVVGSIPGQTPLRSMPTFVSDTKQYNLLVYCIYAYETLPQRLHDTLGCTYKDCCPNTHSLTYLLTYWAKGVHAMRLERQPRSWRRVTAAYTTKAPYNVPRHIIHQTSRIYCNQSYKSLKNKKITVRSTNITS